MIDLRSDTVTKPTPAMRRAMAEAEVGDDVYQEDPTVNRLEARAAEIMGKEAGLFVPTGCMGNTIGMTVHTEHGQEVICDSRAHVLNYELSMMAWFAGCLARAIPTERGHLSWEAIAKEIRPVGPHAAPTGLIAVENTHNVAGGTVYPLEQLAEIKRGAESRGLPVHMDGARFFHAATALNVAPVEIAQYADTVMFCLSKGLGAPVGSMLVGTQKQMDKGRLLRKRLGGGMRQAGVLAAAGLVALEEMRGRLGEDHANAAYLAEALAQLPGIAVEPYAGTNIVFFDVAGTGMTAAELADRLLAKGVVMIAMGPYRMRAVTHFDVDRAACEEAVALLGQLLHN
jgi:threonine aldolase